MLRLPEAHHRSLYHRHGQEVPPRALCLCLLPQAAQQGHLQGAERQALLPELLCEALLLGRPHHPPRPAPPTATVTQGPRPGMTGQSNRNWNLVLAGADADGTVEVMLVPPPTRAQGPSFPSLALPASVRRRVLMSQHPQQSLTHLSAVGSGRGSFTLISLSYPEHTGDTGPL